MDRVIEMLKQDSNRISILKIVHDLNLPQCYVTVGFIRNLVWDYCHGYDPTELNDIDVIYYNDYEKDFSQCSKIQDNLNKAYPFHNLEVKNQALMHLRNKDGKYKNTIDAMSYWPEKETAVAARYLKNDEIEVISVFNINLLFSNTISHNPNRSIEIFNTRINNKKWLEKWQKLEVKY